MTSWVGHDGAPSPHLVRAAVHVASIIDQAGSHTGDLAASYLRRPTGGLYPPEDLKHAENMLLDCGLLTQHGEYLRPTSSLIEFAGGVPEDLVSLICMKAIDRLQALQIPTMDLAVRSFSDELHGLVENAERREEILLALSRRFADADRVMRGEIGEEIVVGALRSDLSDLGYADLARAVRRVSLESDQLGYDIRAPRVMGAPRLIEVKATALNPGDEITIYISRNEADTGVRFREWALVACSITNLIERTGDVLGWCSGADLAPLLPSDSTTSVWREARVTLDVALLIPGLPSSV